MDRTEKNQKKERKKQTNEANDICFKKKEYTYLPTPPLGQDMTPGQFLSGV